MLAMPLGFVVEPLGPDHDRNDFACGNPGLDRYLREFARQDRKRRAASPYVLVTTAERRIAGYYTLSMSAAELAEFPPDTAKRLPPYREVPAALLGRLAVDSRYRRQGLGAFLLLHALDRALSVSAQVASTVVIVDAIDDAAVAFYRRHGFIPFPRQANRLYLPMSTIAGMKT